MPATEQTGPTPLDPPPGKRDSVVVIDATILPVEGGYRQVLLEPDFATLKHHGADGGERKVVWRFHDVPTDFTPSIVPVRFDPKSGPGGTHQVFLRPFKDLILDAETITGEPYQSAAGTCYYEVMLLPRRGVRSEPIRLYCTTSEMGGIEIEPPPSGGG